MFQLATLTSVLLALAGCASKTAPPSPPPATAATAEASTASACPAPKQTTDACAAVMVYVKNPANGACCAYGSPCTVPIAGQQFSDDKCTSPMGPPAK